ARLGYEFKRQAGSHMQYSTHEEGGLLVTIPDHSPVKPRTLSRILRRIGMHHGMTRDQLLQLLFDPDSL
ncbi:type II toxin-antitoxin system HicA family toxin, partial [bacterium]|nr:type II toxin-antitoxin system HicA family toxin [bacterium]